MKGYILKAEKIAQRKKEKLAHAATCQRIKDEARKYIRENTVEIDGKKYLHLKGY